MSTCSERLIHCGTGLLRFCSGQRVVRDIRRSVGMLIMNPAHAAISRGSSGRMAGTQRPAASGMSEPFRGGMRPLPGADEAVITAGRGNERGAVAPIVVISGVYN